MFSSVGWFEISVVVVLGLIIIGPERMPGVIADVRAAIYAARKAINNAKAELGGELGEMGQEFESLRGPISTAAEWGRMGPRAALTKAIFDGDDSAWDDFDLRKTAAPQDAANTAAGAAGAAGTAGAAGQNPSLADAAPTSGRTQPGMTPPAAGAQQGAGFDYSQIFAAEPAHAAPATPATPTPGTKQSPAQGASANAGDTGTQKAEPTPPRGGTDPAGELKFSWKDVT